MSKPEHVIIAGAGLVGSLMALLLGRRGYRVTVLEQRPDMRRREMSAGRSINLALSERGIHALEMAGLMDDVKPLLIPMRGRMLHERDGSLEFSPYGQRPDEVIYSVSRGELNKLMMTAAETHCEVDIMFDQEIRQINFETSVIQMYDRLADASSRLGFELLIGADGVGSAARNAVIKANGGQCAIEMLDHDYKELSIPPGDNGEFRMEKEALHIWPRGGYMLIALPNLDGSYTVTLFLPSTGNPSFELIDEPHELKQFFEQQFPDATALIPDLHAEYFGNPTGELGTVRCDRWIHQDQAILIGDASHGIVPFHGQGMNAGFEDCSELCRLLDESNEDWRQTMAEFERTRIPCTNAIADMALENYVIMRDSVLEDDFQLKKEIGFELEREFPNQFIPRYSMVMFHRIPYDLVKDRGAVQDEILTELISGMGASGQYDRETARRLITERLQPL